jgi:hypothetical protein
LTLEEALEKDFVRPFSEYPTKEEIEALEKAALPKVVNKMGLINEEDAGTEKDFLRISMKEEDREFVKFLNKMRQTDKEMKKYPVETLEENWDEDPSEFIIKVRETRNRSRKRDVK